MSRPLHIAIAGPVATADVRPLLPAGQGWPQGYGGAPMMATLIHELLRRGHRVSAVTLSADLPLRRSGHHGSRVTVQSGGFSLTWCPMRPKAWPFNPAESIGWLPGRIVDAYRFERRHLRAALESLGPDIVHAHWAYEFALAAIASGLPHLVTCHDLPFTEVRHQTLLRRRLYRWVRWRMSRRVMARARALSAPSPWLSQALAGQARVPVSVVPNPLPDRLFGDESSAIRQRASGSRSRVLSVANGFVGRKNVQRGLEAFALLSRSRPEAELVLLGDQMGPGDEAERWWRASGQAGRVHFGGSVAPQVVHHWMSQSDVLLHPALEESFGVAVAEALALGLPVVAGHRSGAVPWLVGQHGWLVDVDSPEAMAGALAEVLGPRGPVLQRVAPAREAMRSSFRADVVGDAYEALYLDVIGRRST